MIDSPKDSSSSLDVIPTAIVQTQSEARASMATRFWWLTGICGLVSVGLWWYSSRTTGDSIEIEFQQGHGLKPEDRISYHGIDVGSVEKVSLKQNNTGVVVRVRLMPESRSIANEGARFWIVRPSFSLDSIQGLDTLVGAKYIAVEPAANQTKLQKQFIGLEFAPVVSPPDGALEIVLDGRTRGGLENGAPILFRGFAIGKVVQVGLASDARTVRARCAIDPEYRELIRKNTKFWNRSGWRLDIGLSGIKLDADTVSQIVSGGIEMATPPDFAPTVSTGQRFVLHDKAEPEWQNWQPSIAYGTAWSKLETRLPQPIRIALRWQERSFGFRTNRQQVAWCLPLSDGSMISHSEQVIAPKSSIQDSVTLEFAGLAIKPDQIVVGESIQGAGSSGESGTFGESIEVIRWKPKESLPGDISGWNVADLVYSLPKEVCNVVVAHADSSSSVAIDAARLQAVPGGWQIDESVAMDRDLHGLPVVSESSRKVIGLLSLNAGKKSILPLTSTPK